MSETIPTPRSPRCRTTHSRVLAVVILLTALAPTAALAQTGEGLPAPVTWERADVPTTPAGIELWDVTAGGPGFIAVGGGFEEGARGRHRPHPASPRTAATWQRRAALRGSRPGYPPRHHRHA